MQWRNVANPTFLNCWQQRIPVPLDSSDLCATPSFVGASTYQGYPCEICPSAGIRWEPTYCGCNLAIVLDALPVGNQSGERVSIPSRKHDARSKVRVPLRSARRESPLRNELGPYIKELRHKWNFMYNSNLHILKNPAATAAFLRYYMELIPPLWQIFLLWISSRTKDT